MPKIGDGRTTCWSAALPLYAAVLFGGAGDLKAQILQPETSASPFLSRFNGEEAASLRFLGPEAIALPLPPEPDSQPSWLDPKPMGPPKAGFASADPNRTGGVSEGGRSDVCPEPSVASVEPSAAQSLEEGDAVWYQLPGNTANGEVFDPDGFTAGHRTLPFGTWIRVVNQENGRSVIVRINDRGPVQRKFVIDLSRGSARALGIEGKARVSLYPAQAPEKARTPIAQSVERPR